MNLLDANLPWDALRQGLSERLSEASYHEWVTPCVPQRFDGESLWIEVPSSSAKVWIEQQLAEEFSDALAAVDLAHLRLVFSVSGEQGPPAKVNSQTSHSLAAGGLPQTPAFPQLFHRYTLDRFVVGPSSRLAFSAAQAVVDNFGKASGPFNMNPLFLYGAAGLGKTHLMIGIGMALQADHPDLSVCYLKVDSFFHELTVAIKARNTEPLRRKYQAHDVLLLDDVQTLRTMERTQEEIFYILEFLLQHGRQIVITSDNPPQKLEGMHERLITRCKWGLTADIAPPDFETRIAILRKKLEDEFLCDFQVPSEVLAFIAHKAKGSVRDLEGLLKRVVFQASFMGVPPSLDVAHVAYQGQSGLEPGAPIPVTRIYKTTAESFNIPYADLMKKKSRQQAVLVPRQVAMYLARELTGTSLADIGKSFNNMHHSTVMNAIASVQARMKKDEEFLRTVQGLMNSIH